MRLIDADAFSEKLASLHGEGGYEADIYCAEGAWSKGKWIWLDPEDYGIEAAEKALKEAPTVDLVIHGKWTETKEHAHAGENTWEWTNFYCSECDAPSDSPYEFCPYCGTKMDGD